MRSLVSLLVLAVALGGCSDPAPAVGTPIERCFDGFCVMVPEGWDFTGDATNVQFETAEGGYAYVSAVDLAYLADSAGVGSGAALVDIDGGYWTLLDAIGGRLDGQDSRAGWTASRGDTDLGRRWHALLAEGVAMTVDLPSGAWDAHGRVWVEGLRSN